MPKILLIPPATHSGLGTDHENPYRSILSICAVCLCDCITLDHLFLDDEALRLSGKAHFVGFAG